MTCGGEVEDEKPPPIVETTTELTERISNPVPVYAPFVDERTAYDVKETNYERHIDELENEIEELEAEVESYVDENTRLMDEVSSVGTESMRYNGESSSENTRAESTEEVSKASTEETPQVGTTFEATHYTAYCPTGCTGVTATGVDVSNTIYHEGKRVIAVDPSVIPLGSTVQVTTSDGSTFEATSQDTGGDIKGNRIDILVGSREEAYQLGRQDVTVKVIK